MSNKLTFINKLNKYKLDNIFLNCLLINVHILIIADASSNYVSDF